MCDISRDDFDRGIDLLHRQRLTDLGNSALGKSLPVRRTIGSRLSAYNRGKATFQVMTDLIRRNFEWQGQPGNGLLTRSFQLLNQFYLLGATMEAVASLMNLSTAQCYEVKKGVVSDLWLVFQEAERDARTWFQGVLLEGFSFPNNEYVDRRMNGGESWVDAVTSGLVLRRPWSVSITGLPGVGKTRLAQEVVISCAVEAVYDMFLWTSYGPERGMVITSAGSLLEDVSRRLKNRVTLAMTEYDDQLEVVCKEIEDLNKCGKRVLIIVDATDFLAFEDKARLQDLSSRLPPNASLLTTSSDAAKNGASHLMELRGMLPEESVAFIRATGKGPGLPIDQDQLAQVVEKCEGRPLALYQAVRVLEAGCENFDDLFAARDSDEILRRLFERIYERLSTEQRKLCWAVYMFPEGVDDELLRSMTNRQPTDELEFGNDLRVLADFRLILEVQSGFWNTLYLTRQYLRQSLPAAKLADRPVRDVLADMCTRASAHYCGLLQGMNMGARAGWLKALQRNTLFCLIDRAAEYELSACVTSLFDLIGPVLGTYLLVNERAKLARMAISAAQSMGRLDLAAWFRVNDIAYGHVQQREFDSVLEIVEPTLLEAEKALASRSDSEEAVVRWKRCRAQCLRQIGLEASWRAKDSKRALGLFQDAMEIFQQVGDHENYAYCASSIGDVYLDQEDFAKAQEHFRVSYSVRKLSIQEPGGIGAALADLAYCVSKAGSVREALQLSSQALTLAEKIQHPSMAYVVAAARHGLILYEAKDLASAQVYIERAMDELKRVDKTQTFPSSDAGKIEQVRKTLREKIGPYRADEETNGGILEM